VGFPHSVSPDYFAYQTFDSLQAFFSTVSSLLANRALLQGLGVGDASSSATFALLLTILKDGTSRVATIVFAHRFGLAIEPECKRYRFLADLFNDSAFFLDLLSPSLGPWAKVLTLSAGEALRALCGVAAGASKAALSSHFAQFDNLAELNAKEASQETAVGLFGLLVGSVVVRLFWLMVCLVFAHLWMNYLGVRCVRLGTLNRQRATLVFEEYLRSGRIIGPEETARRELIVTWRPIVKNRKGQPTVRISFAKSYMDAMGTAHARRSVQFLEEDGYSLFQWNGVRTPRPVKIMLWEKSTSEQAIAAWFHAMELAWRMEPSQGVMPTVGSDSNQDLRNNAMFLRSERPQWSAELMGEKLRAAGWDTSSVSFETTAPLRLQAKVYQGEPTVYGDQDVDTKKSVHGGSVREKQQ
jgi:hypothetical protein